MLKTECPNTCLKDISDSDSIRNLNHTSVREECCGHVPEGPMRKGMIKAIMRKYRPHTMLKPDLTC